MLNVDCVQPALVSMLLDRLPEFAIVDDPSC
jgi:hypothetical protein